MTHSESLARRASPENSSFSGATGDPFVDAFPKSVAAAARTRARRRRDDGWTPSRIRTFLRRLAECGVVEDAARAAGMSRQSAYTLRTRAAGRSFDLAWDAALQRARGRLADEAMSRALEGWTERIIRDGQVWGERNRYDNRLTMRVLERLDRLAMARDEDSLNVRLVAQEFGEFLDIVCTGRDGDAAAFLATRLEAERAWVPSREARLLGRLEAYVRGGGDLPEPDDDARPDGLDDGVAWDGR